MVYYTDVMNTRAKAPVGVYISAFIVLFFCGLSFSDSVGFVPCEIDSTCERSLPLSSLPTLGDFIATSTDSASVAENGIKPTHIEIPAVGIDLPIQNPNTTDIEALDALLVNGPARYVESAQLGEKGNVLIFAHSSHLPIVHNQMFRAFNKIPDLKAGDSITLTGHDGSRYLYAVEKVEKADAENYVIDLSAEGQKLTLVTCDTLTNKTARFVLTARFVGTL